MIDTSTLQDLIQRVDEVIAIMTENDSDCYVALEIAYQLRDELQVVSTDDSDD